jgi:hypothetical protein
MGPMRRKRVSAASIVGPTAVLVCVALAALAASGCGGSAYASQNLSPAAAVQAAATQAVETAGTTVVTRPVAPTGPSAALHDRVMAEQGRVPGASAADRPTTSTSTSLPEPAATESPPTAPVVPPAEQGGATATVLTEGQTPLVGVWSGTADQLASYLERVAPSPCFTVPTLSLAGYYVYYCADAGLRADLLWAQMIHETGYGRYGGDVWPEQNNYAGIGATGGHEPGASFAKAEAGVMAHVAHMVAYVYQSSPVSWADSSTDPRFDFVSPRGAAYVLADLNGRWAVPGTEYGQRIEDVARAINGG